SASQRGKGKPLGQEIQTLFKLDGRTHGGPRIILVPFYHLRVRIQVISRFVVSEQGMFHMIVFLVLGVVGRKKDRIRSHYIIVDACPSLNGTCVIIEDAA